jgi:hypothetical protein
MIEEAQQKRFKIPQDDPKNQGILISEQWMQEL